MGGQAGVYQPGYGTYAPAAADPYAGYYQVSNVRLDHRLG